MPDIKEIIEKLGFDPLDPPKRKGDENPWLIDDHTPSPYSVLSSEERKYLMVYIKEHKHS